jgi:uncharacterized protein (DUF1697 family)
MKKILQSGKVVFMAGEKYPEIYRKIEDLYNKAA